MLLGGDGWVLIIVNRLNENRSELAIFDALKISAGPVALYDIGVRVRSLSGGLIVAERPIYIARPFGSAHIIDATDPDPGTEPDLDDPTIARLAAALSHADVREACLSFALTPRAGPAERRAELARVHAQLQVRNLVPGLFRVPSVGQEHPAVRGQQQLPVRPGEPGQEPDVGQPGDQEGVDPQVREPGCEASASGDEVHERR